jgi:hypothetical protein
LVVVDVHRWPGSGRDDALDLQATAGEARHFSEEGDALSGAVIYCMRYYTDDPAPFVGKYQLAVGGNQGAFAIDVTQSPSGLAFSFNGSRPEALPWADGLRFYASETVTLTFRRANGDTGPVTELRRDDSGNHAILKKQ